jgi:hypothetical protein
MPLMTEGISLAKGKLLHMDRISVKKETFICWYIQQKLKSYPYVKRVSLLLTENTKERGFIQENFFVYYWRPIFLNF